MLRDLFRWVIQQGVNLTQSIVFRPKQQQKQEVTEMPKTTPKTPPTPPKNPETQTKSDSMIKPSQYLESLLDPENRGKKAELEFLSMIPNWSNPNANALSAIYHAFKGLDPENRASDIPVGLPIFAFFGLMASECVANEVKYLRPSQKDWKSALSEDEYKEHLAEWSESLNLWLLLLADSGDSKTLAMNIMRQATGIKENFNSVNSALALAQAFSENPKGLWINDEFGQLWEIMQGKTSDGADWKRVFLKGRDGETEWKSKATQIEYRNDLEITGIFTNTEAQFNASTTEQSLNDGMTRRLTLGYVVEGDLKSNFNFLSTDKTKLVKAIQPACIETLERVRSYQKEVFDFSPEAYTAASNVYKMAGSLYGSTLGKAFIKTYLNECWKFAVYMHILTKEEGTTINAETMERGLSVGLVLLESFQKFMSRRSKFERPSPTATNRNKLTANPKKIHASTNSDVSLIAERLEFLKRKTKEKGELLQKRDIRRIYPRIPKEDYQTLCQLYENDNA